MPFKPSNPDKLVWMEGNKEASIVQWHFQTRQRSEFMEILASISGDVGGSEGMFSCHKHSSASGTQADLCTATTGSNCF